MQQWNEAFRKMALIKTKLRNRMQQPLLEAILHVRAYMSRHHICCSAFKPSKDMLSLFTSNMYQIAENVADDEVDF